jgi:hypothetical protein
MKNKLLGTFKFSVSGSLMVLPLWVISFLIVFIGASMSDANKDFLIIQILAFYTGIFLFIVLSVFSFSVFFEIYKDEEVSKKSFIFILFLILSISSIVLQLILLTGTLGLITIAIFIALSLEKKHKKKNEKFRDL